MRSFIALMLETYGSVEDVGSCFEMWGMNQMMRYDDRVEEMGCKEDTTSCDFNVEHMDGTKCKCVRKKDHS